MTALRWQILVILVLVHVLFYTKPSNCTFIVAGKPACCGYGAFIIRLARPIFC